VISFIFSIHKVLFEYQREGVQWLSSLYESGVGGILGDEMGLGKTAQLCCHFGSLARKHRKLRKKNGIFLVVCPATVLQHWLKEFHHWVGYLEDILMLYTYLFMSRSFYICMYSYVHIYAYIYDIPRSISSP
jgi:DNA excision repair protein ERCC-6